MTLYRYFERDDSVLPKPHGSLSKVVPVSTIAATNEAVKKVLDSDMGPSEKDAACSSRRGAYEQFIPKGKGLHWDKGSGTRHNSYLTFLF